MSPVATPKKVPSFGQWAFAGLIIVIGVATLEYYDVRYAWGLTFVILMAVFFRYPTALGQIQQMMGLPS